MKYFTPKEVNELLPVIKPLVARILSMGKALRSLVEENFGSDIPAQARQAEKEITELMIKLEGMGCFFKDWNFEIGLVDFPAIIDGKEALLCWRSDEAEVLWYHGLEDGFSGRRPIPEYWLLSGIMVE